MGNFNTKDLDVKRLNNISIGRLWDKYCKSDEISQSEFVNFFLTLSSSVGVQVDNLDIGIVFNSLQKEGTVNFQKFYSNFDQWSFKKIEEIEGVPVLQPAINLTLINKYYQVQVPYDTYVCKRIPFHNPSEEQKSLKITSSNPEILKIRTLTLKLQPNSVEYIKIKIKSTLKVDVIVSISHFSTDAVEETLCFKIIPITTSNIEVIHPVN